MKKIFLLVIACFLLLDGGSTYAKSKKSKKSKATKEIEEVDYLDLAGELIRSGAYEKAGVELKKVDLNIEGIDFARFYTFSGLVTLHGKRFKKSIRHFQKAIAFGQKNLVVYVYLAQAYYGLNEYQQTLNALKQAKEKGELPGLYKIRINCHWLLKQREETFAVLERAVLKWPAMTVFVKQKIIYLINLGLYKKATEEGLQFLQRPGSVAADYLLIGESMRRSKQLNEAIKILELARLKFKHDVKVIYALAHTYTDKKAYRSAATLFEEASRIDPKYTTQAVELYRKAKKFTKAISLNAEVKEQRVKTKQRLGILLAQKRYVGVVSLKDRLVRLELLKDQKIAYVYAYALFKTGAFEKAMKCVQALDDASLHSKKVRLLEAIEVYRHSEWQIP